MRKYDTFQRSPELDEQKLLDAARKGDQNAFKEFIEKYEHKVARTVFSMLGNCSEAEDVGQETFIRFYRSLDRFRGESNVGTYLTRIAINLSLNELKRRGRREKIFFLKPAYRGEKDILDNLPAGNPGTNREESKEIVQLGLRKLKPQFRAVLVLRLLHGYSTKETAEILDLPVGTVLSRLKRAQMKLKEILKPFWEVQNVSKTG
ncbi:MAG: RNA polymerase sigma factor [Candidatus Aminicenantes bacterium]|nr:RNA polymerase sigma factor [Candidatus Aminicenantes bacterium]